MNPCMLLQDNLVWAKVSLILWELFTFWKSKCLWYWLPLDFLLSALWAVVWLYITVVEFAVKLRHHIALLEFTGLQCLANSSYGYQCQVALKYNFMLWCGLPKPRAGTTNVWQCPWIFLYITQHYFLMIHAWRKGWMINALLCFNTC